VAGQKERFLEAVANAIAADPAPGPGTVYRLAQTLQRDFVTEARCSAEG
jgi:hypothetical protein